MAPKKGNPDGVEEGCSRWCRRRVIQMVSMKGAPDGVPKKGNPDGVDEGRSRWCRRRVIQMVLMKGAPDGAVEGGIQVP